MTTHKCSRCAEDKPIDQYYANKWQCKSCISQLRREHYDANSDRVRARCRAYYDQWMRKPKQVAA